MVLRLTNGFGFDPIRPAPGVFGWIRLEVRSADRVVASLLIDGRTTTFRQNTTLAPVLTFEPGPIAQPLEVTVHVESPAGDRVRIDTRQRIDADIQSGDIRMTGVRVAFAGEDMPAETLVFDAGGLDDSVIERLRGGAIVVYFDNPLPLAGEFDMSVGSTLGPLPRKLSFAGPGVDTLRATFDAAEIRAILESPAVELNIGGRIRGATDTVTIVPVTGLRIRTELELRLRYR